MTERILLRDGSEASDPRLDRLPSFDERSRAFGVSNVLPAEFKSKTWRLHDRLDQGRDGACVGFGHSHRIAALPISGKVSYDSALALYHRAQNLDQWAGSDYEGTSVLAGAKAAKEKGHYAEYRWCFSVEDIMRAVAHEGPVVVGTDWLEDMFSPDGRGLLSLTGAKAGGHCYIIRGLTLEPRGVRKGVGPVFRITNSWGKDWGENGEAFIRVEDYERVLFPGSDACVPLERRATTTTEEDHVSEKRGKGKFPWGPGGSSLFDRVLGYGYTPGANRLTGKGKPAGLFKKGPFRLGR